jgi:hypothetical protein
MREHFTLSFRLSEVSETAVYRRLILRYFGWPRTILAPVLVIAVASMGGLFVHYVLAINMLTPAAIAGAYVVIIAFIVAGIAGRLQMRPMHRETLAAPFRQRLNTIEVSGYGITRNGALSGWDQFTDHFDMPTQTIVMSSPKEAVILPHHALQNGATGAELLESISHWRQQAIDC